MFVFLRKLAEQQTTFGGPLQQRSSGRSTALPLSDAHHRATFEVLHSSRYQTG